MRTVTMLKKLQELGFELKPDPEKLYKWVFEDMLEDRWSDNILTCGNDRDDLILETYEGIFLGKYRDSKDYSPRRDDSRHTGTAHSQYVI